MPAHLYLAAAGHGKTAYGLAHIRKTRAADPLTSVSVILPNQAQLNAFRYRLSAQGGALGVNLTTFYTLYAEILAWAGKPEPRLPEPVQYRLLRAIIAELTDSGRLSYYASLRDKPGFVATLRTLLEEIKRARIRRDDFFQAIQALPNPTSRLAELADIYTAYQDWLLENGWVDIEGQGWLAASALERQPDLGRHLHLLIIDGFDEFNPTQLAVLKLLAGRAAETIITLTGEMRSRGAEGQGRRGELEIENYKSKIQNRNSKTVRPALRRFTRALQVLSRALDLEPEPLPESPVSSVVPALAYLEANLFEVSIQAPVSRSPFHDSVIFIETQNRAEEVRAALRWLKARLVRDQMSAGQMALIARDLTPYRPFIEETAAEFGLTLHLREGLNLATNPAIAGLMSLLALPLKNRPGSNWAYRPLVETWRSPYFENLASGLTPRSAAYLRAVARQGLVLHGLNQWREAFAQQLQRASPQSDTTALADEEGHRPDYLSQDDTHALHLAFETFVVRLTPPAQATLQAYVAYVENLIGQDPELEQNEDEAEPHAALSLGIVRRARLAPATAGRDIAALRAFKDVLRGLVLAGDFFRQSAAEAEVITYQHFFEELQGAVQGTTYYLPPPEPMEAALPVLSVLNVRGLSFRAVALLGLSEGEFPRAEREDILLREEDRFALQQVGLTGLEPRLRGDEITFFYEAVTRAREKLLLCRPYLADDGQQWEPSLYWQQVRRLATESPVAHIRPEDPLPPWEVASPQELAGTLTQLGLAGLELAEHWSPHHTAHLQHSGHVLQARLAAKAQGPFEGDLSALSPQFSTVYGPEHVWSSSRLEAYGLCPHHFWLGQDLALEPRQAPVEGFDVFILGSMYHEILEKVYHQAGTEVGCERLLELLPAVAKAVFDQAPAAYGFRPTPLWDMQRRELEQIITQTLVALAEATAGSTPLVQEQVFGMSDKPPLVVQSSSGDEFRVRGFIDRVDEDAEGRLRIIDYKSGSTPIVARDLVEGRRLQIALYALAARDTLRLGEVADGFYWHIGSAKASSLKLANFEGGLEAALKSAITHAFNHIAGVRAGHFTPAPPSAGCPNHCPGANFCWRYKAKGW